MTSAPGDIQWYIARDGKQHGPISDVEMNTFVELGHLQPTDLLWRAGFPDWRPAPMVFPPKRAAPPAPPPPPPRPAAPRAEPMVHRLEPGEVATHAVAQAPRDAAAGTAGAAATAPARAPGPGYAPLAADARSGGQPGPAAAMPAAEPGRLAPHPAPEQKAPFFPLERHDLDEDEYDDEPERKSRGFAIAATIVLLVLLGSGAFLGYQFRDRLLALALGGGGEAAAPAVVRAPETPTKSAAAPEAETPPQAAPAAAAPAPQAESPAASDDADISRVDAHYQQSPLWSTAKRALPDWYNERMKDVAELESQQGSQAAIARYLVEELVVLRRTNADKALAASHDRLKGIATAFLDNLKQLSAHGAETCYGFISQGEASPRIIELFQKPEQAAPIEAQAKAIIEAIAEGQTSPVQHTRPQKSDYDMLATELGKLGWSQADLQLFSDPKALARAEPIRICKMVQDWFHAHIAIQDAAVQERLLFETLRPVVAG